MKKFILVLAATVLAAVAVSAQPRAIGARLGWGAEVSYQHSLGVDNMLSAELSFPGFIGGVGAAATYDWLNPFNTAIPWNHKGEWNWYLGAGAGLGFGWPDVEKSTVGDVTYKTSANWFSIGVAGRVGIEYEFWFPLQLSLDWRPTIGPSFSWARTTASGGGVDVNERSHSTGFYLDGLWAGAISLGVRYKF